MSNQEKKFGTFSGVFRPNVLTILGLTFYLRVGWVVGESGLTNALIIILLANLVTILTGLSISTIATGMPVKAGGNYYMISRSLGQEIGGTIGLQLYLSQAISVAFYTVGFTEVFTSIDQFKDINPQILGSCVVLFFAVVSYIGTGFAMKLHFVMFIILILTIASFFTGGWGEITAPNWTSTYTEGENFWTVFAVFFPAVTGIAIGTSMSGYLKKPEENIPKGTMYSIAITCIIYLLSAVWYGVHATQDELKTNFVIMQEMALFPMMILVGMVSSTLSSTLNSTFAAPRLLTVMSDDGIVPKILAHKMGSKTEPGVAILVTFFISVAFIWVGGINEIAPIVSMFFLNTYGMTNLVAFIETVVQNPSFRPKFKVPAIIYLIGGIGCYATMYLISPMATGLGIVISASIYIWLTKKQIQQNWGDVRSGIWKSIAKFALFKIEQKGSSKNWRLNIIVFSKYRDQLDSLIDFINRLKYGHGITTIMELITYNSDEGKDFLKIREDKLNEVKQVIKKKNCNAFAEVTLVSDIENSIITISQANGTGSMEPNTALMGKSHTKEGRLQQLEIAQQLNNLNKTVLMYNKNERKEALYPDNVDIWWRGDKNDFNIMIMLAHLLTMHKTRIRGKIRIFRFAKSQSDGINENNYIQDVLKKANINAVVETIEGTEEEFFECIEKRSNENGLAMLGFYNIKELGEEFIEKINELSKKTNSLLLVSGANLEKSSSHTVPMENLLNI